MDLTGTVLDGAWHLDRLIGRGGMGSVYAAHACEDAAERVAVKVLDPVLARRADIRERFRREGYAADRVRHPGAVRVIDDGGAAGGGAPGADDDLAYIVMELLDGESLEARVEEGRSPTELETLAIVASALDVLDAAHANGVVHRDLKPANLFLTRSGDPLVKVLDFGLARVEELRGATGAGLTLGTPSFMAPELAAGRSDDVDGRTDLFAIGATAFFVLTGRTVHEAESPVRLVLAMAREPAPKLRTVAPTVSPLVARVVDRALAFDRDERYPSAAAMRADVLAAIDESIARF